jgi:hypothetical protein
MIALPVAIFLASGSASAGSIVRYVDLAAPPVAALHAGRTFAVRAPEGVLLRVGEGALSAEQAGVAPTLVAGPTLSLDVANADIHSVLRLIGATADLDFVLDESVQAKVTARLVDVPWNYALLAILQTHGLVALPVEGGGMVEIAPAG